MIEFTEYHSQTNSELTSKLLFNPGIFETGPLKIRGSGVTILIF